ncbi:MAG TPA: radical SAM protein [Nannocystis sp.]
MLLQPPGACREFTRSGSSYPPLGLCHLAALVPRELAVVLDADGEGLDEAATLAAIDVLSPRVVGLTATSYTLELIERWARPLAARGIAVIAGGPHASLAPVDLLRRCPSVEHAFMGEGEPVFPDIVARAAAGQPLRGLPGVLTRGDDVPPEIVRCDSFEDVPFVDFTGLPVERYGCPDARRRPMLTLLTARGCPHRCGFCSSPTLLGRKLRGPSVEQVLMQLDLLVERHGVREISFVDDVFTLPPRRALALCRGMIDFGFDLSWFCNARADQITDELAAAMAAAGCHQVYLGFESGSQDILDRIHKGTTVAALERGAEILRRHGIARSVGFVIGLPGETDATVDASIELALRVQPERLQFTRFTPLVGSPLYEEARTRGARSLGFHQRVRDDQVDVWIARAYAACRADDWGKESW